MARSNTLLWIAAAGAALLLGAKASASQGAAPNQGAAPELDAEQKSMAALIAKIARAQGVPVQVALAFAWLESRLRVAAQGDKEWATSRPDKYKSAVLDRQPPSPWAKDAALWHSYGLFQLLAPYFVKPSEHPHLLLNPQINAERGIAFIKAKLAQSGGDVEAARLAYAGATNASAATKAKILTRLRTALAMFEGVE